MNFITRKLAARVLAGGAASLALLQSAQAALPEEATTAITAAKTDLLAAIGMVIAAMVAVWGLRKLGQKMGWL
jgi:flagellar biogenesis protein FliO